MQLVISYVGGITKVAVSMHRLRRG